MNKLYLSGSCHLPDAMAAYLDISPTLELFTLPIQNQTRFRCTLRLGHNVTLLTMK